jgi:hypothetical protein
MRTALYAFAMTVSMFVLASPAIASPYCDGYKDGYRKGFCNGKEKCRFGETRRCRGEDKSPNTYEAGFARGFRDGDSRAVEPASSESDSSNIPSDGLRQDCELVEVGPGQYMRSCRAY